METLKKIAKDLYLLGIVAACILVLFIYRLAVTADISTITVNKATSKINNADTFVLVTGSDTVGTTVEYKNTIEQYLKKNRSAKIFYVDLGSVEDAQEFVGTYLGEVTADTTNPHTYFIKDGKVDSKREGSLGYYTLDKAISDFKK